MTLALVPPLRSALDLPHGLHEDVPEDVYHRKVPGIASKHALDLVLEAPAKYRAWLEDLEEEPTPAMLFGQAFHTALLLPAQYEPNMRTVRGREDAARIAGMVGAVRAHPTASRMLERGLPEVTARWRDAATGLECKARADLWLPELAVLADAKSCTDASRDAFARAVANNGYHAQDAMYCEGFEVAGGRAVDAFVLIAVEKVRPHLCAVYVLEDAARDVGRRRIRRALDTLHDCIEADVWPGYPETIQQLALPRWATETP